MDPKDDDKKDEDKGFELGQISFGIGGGTPAEAEPMAERRGSYPTEPPTAERAPVSARQPSTPPEEAMPLLPLRAILVADLLPRGEFNAGANAPEQAIRIDPTHLEGLFEKLRPRLAIEVESVLQEGAKVRIDLSPTSMGSFRPDALCREVPLLRSLLDGKTILERLRDGSLTPEQAGGELSRLWKGSPLVGRVLNLVEAPAAPGGRAVPAAPAPAADAGVDRILDMVDTGTEADAPAVAPDQTPAPAPAPKPAQQGRFGEFIAAVAHSGKERAGARPDEAIRRVEKALGYQLGIILQHPELRRLETAWRGLDFLVKRSSNHAGTRLELVCAGPDDAAEALDRAIRAGATVEPPVTFALVDEVVDGSAASLSRLRAIAEVAEAHTVPTLLNTTPELFGHGNLASIDRLDNKASLYEAPERAPWRAATAQLPMRWVTLAMNRVLARTAYDARTSRIRAATVAELPGEQAATIWMQPAWAVASLVLLSFRKTGWPCRITGARDGGTIENLPVQEVPSTYGGEQVAVPTEALLAVESQRILARYGVLALATAPNSDEAYVVSAPTAYVTPPKKTYDSETTEPELRLPRVALGDQLFVARVVQFLRALGSKIPPDSPPDQVKPIMEAALWELFENSPPSGPEIDLQVAGDQAASAVAVTIRPRRYLGVSLEEISLEVPLG
ncbi:MAG: type VI secretion system contractile sheath large subunit [Deltaproteobacteria bacterium]|nr:type VI secretion system contractile sheath large subunit [Deltaproteobacteria bacterium]MBW2534084.1 type VI secretion system contractile sheath large subunit [Deltaproteobacteria bacterium]